VNHGSGVWTAVGEGRHCFHAKLFDRLPRPPEGILHRSLFAAKI
jgi:hypothetical protein